MDKQQLCKAAKSTDYMFWRDGVHKKSTRMVAAEKPVAFSYNGTTHAVMMATPVNLEDFARGFSLTEGLISSLSDIEEMVVLELDQGIDIQFKLNTVRQDAFQKRRRHMAGPVGCGLCGMESIEAAMRDLPKVLEGGSFSATNIVEAVRSLKTTQFLNSEAGAMHAAGFYKEGAGLVLMREDVGRHNALDKLCGALMGAGQKAADGAVVVTSRLSVEMVQKTVMMGASILIAFSAPTVEAVRVGRQTNLTLIARARENEFEIYSGEERIRF